MVTFRRSSLFNNKSINYTLKVGQAAFEDHENETRLLRKIVYGV
jgi:hypothetical protein